MKGSIAAFLSAVKSLFDAKRDFNGHNDYTYK